MFCKMEVLSSMHPYTSEHTAAGSAPRKRDKRQKEGFKNFYISRKTSHGAPNPQSVPDRKLSAPAAVGRPADPNGENNGYSSGYTNGCSNGLSPDKVTASHDIVEEGASTDTGKEDTGTLPQRSLGKLQTSGSDTDCEDLVPWRKSSNAPRSSLCGPHPTQNSEMFPRWLGGREETLSPAQRELHTVLTTVRPRVLPLPGYEDGSRPPPHLTGRHMDLCWDEGLYIGDKVAAMDLAYLKRVGITHVLNAAQGASMCAVDTGEAFYKEADITYLGFTLSDTPDADISPHFERAADFIQDALMSGGRVLVHCYMGISRSATLAAGFLMLRRRHTACEALTTLRLRRHVFPNHGFLAALARLQAAGETR